MKGNVATTCVHSGHATAGNLAGLRVGVYTPWFEDCDADICARCKGALAAFEAAGTRLRL